MDITEEKEESFIIKYEVVLILIHLALNVTFNHSTYLYEL